MTIPAELNRIYKNIKWLLENGQFPGNVAPFITESVRFLSDNIAVIEAQSDHQGQDAAAQAPESVGDQEVQDGVARD